jgi:transcriptional regulator with XRE-family HTH domain
MNEEENKPIPGKRLIDFLKMRADRNDEVMTDIAEHLGVSLSYLSSIFRGVRPISGLSRDALVKAAKYLDLPIAQVYLLADILKLSDFDVEQNVNSFCERAHDALSHDPKWAGYAPSAQNWSELSLDVRMLIGLLYAESGGPLLPPTEN